MTCEREGGREGERERGREGGEVVLISNELSLGLIWTIYNHLSGYNHLSVS
jgi:hypothetical protein